MGLKLLISFEEKVCSALQSLIMPLLWHYKLCSVHILIFIGTGVLSEASSEKGVYVAACKAIKSIAISILIYFGLICCDRMRCLFGITFK